MEHSSQAAIDSDKPAGDLAGRLAALARLFASPIADADTLHFAGLDAENIATADDDDRAAEHYRVLTHDLVPDAGVFFETDGMLGGPLARDLHDLMMGHDFEPDESARSTGHIVNELGFMAHLVRSEQEDALATFWTGHAAGWMPLVAMVLERSDSPPFEALGRALDQALADVAVMAKATTPDGVDHAQTPMPAALPETDLDLDEPKVGLSRIGRFLSIPAHSGLALTRSRISWIGRAFRLPTGFGSRARIVEGLLRSGAQYEGWSDVCNALIEECDRTQGVWESAPVPAYWQDLWTQRLAFTRTILENMRSAQGEGSHV